MHSGSQSAAKIKTAHPRLEACWLSWPNSSYFY
jgi:hypothetical protein